MEQLSLPEIEKKIQELERKKHFILPIAIQPRPIIQKAMDLFVLPHINGVSNKEIDAELKKLYAIRRKLIIDELCSPNNMITIELLKSFVRRFDLDYLKVTYKDTNSVNIEGKDFAATTIYSNAGVADAIYVGIKILK